MAKIVFSNLPMKKELYAFRYVADGRKSMQYEGEVIFPVNSILAKSLKRGEKVKVVLLSKDDPEANSQTNEKIFRAELDRINESVGADITYVNIMTPFVETRSVHENILRAVIARSLVSSGLLPTLGIHHHNRYNAYCLADDMMEPYRPYVDELVYGIVVEYGADLPDDITKDLKMRLLGIPVVEVRIGGKRSPLMVAATQTTASLYKCFTGEMRRIAYPEM